MKTFETEKHNIPEGATHYYHNLGGIGFYRLIDKSWEFWHYFYDCWKPVCDNDCAFEAIQIPQTNIETPEEKEVLDSINSNLIKPREPSNPVITKVEWGGSGLPAVGVECEAVFIEHEHKGYGKFLILGYHDNYVWMEYIGDLSNKSKHYTAKVDMVEFRKHETEAERVERELDVLFKSAIIDIQECKEVKDCNVSIDASFAIMAVVKAMLETGYRKESE